jgi:hypothetical protein
MRLFSRVRSLQRRFPRVPPTGEAYYALLDELELAVFGSDPDDGPPSPPGQRLSDMARARDGWPTGQKATRTDKNPRFTLARLLRRLLPHPAPVA